MPLVGTSERSPISARSIRGAHAFQSPAPTNHTAEELEQIVEDFAKKDEFRDKTWTRVIVESYLSKWKWYFPMRDKENGPCLSKAYAFYEHITLPRYFSGKEAANTVQRKAEPGETEEDTRLYSVWSTKSSSFIEWGIGIDSYFSSLKVVALILLAAGFLNWYNLRYFASSDYSDEKQGDLSYILTGSAICTTFEWVACPGCQPNDFDDTDGDKERYGLGVSEDGMFTVLVQRNVCDRDELLKLGMVNYATFFFLFIALALQAFYLGNREIRADEDMLTASDYSVVVRNPPPDAYDPDDWRDFFSSFASEKGQVTCVTVAINNETMLKKLIARRTHLNNLLLVLPPAIKTKVDDEDFEDLLLNQIAQLERERESEPKGIISRVIGCFFPLFHPFGMFLPPQKLFDRMIKLTEEIKELQKKDYSVSNVFITFETEEGQRAALSALTVGRLDIIGNKTDQMVPGTVFQGRILQMEEPTEPNAVRWLDLSSKFEIRILMRIINLCITIGAVVISALCVVAARKSVGPVLSGPLVSVFNSIIPMIVKILMIFEPHYTEGSYQSSLYLKITLFRWVNTAVLTKFITPFTATITNGSTDLLPTISAVFWSELFITPSIRLLDIGGNLKKHILAPRARTQEQMNDNFRGTFYNLGERYTDFTKVLFLVFFYSALLPAAFWFGFAILMVQHYVDKYCLLRIWGWSPAIGPELARLSRRYFFFGSLLAYSLVSAYAWAQFPYDNLCDPDNPSNTSYAGTYTNVTTLSNEFIPEVNVAQTTPVVFCDQSWRSSSGRTFPATSELQPDDATWMTDNQERLADVYGWTSMGVFVLFFVVLFGSSSMILFQSLFRGTYKPSGKEQHVDFSSNPEIFAYVPQIKRPNFAFPLLACNIDEINQNLIGWNDATSSYDDYNLMFDVPVEGMRQKISVNTRSKAQLMDSEAYRKAVLRSRQRSTPTDERGFEMEQPKTPIFSIIKHYPPPWLQRIMDDQDLPDDKLDTVNEAMSQIEDLNGGGSESVDESVDKSSRFAAL